MSRKSNRLKNRLKAAKQSKAKAEAELFMARLDLQKANATIGKLGQEVHRKSSLSIDIADEPFGMRQHGKHFRVDFVVDSFEYDFLRRGDPDIRHYCSVLARDVAEKVAYAIEDHIKRSPSR